MGDAADDALDAAMREHATIEAMRAAGARRCPNCHQPGRGSFFTDDGECKVCDDLGWIDKDGKPCEP